MRIIMTGNPGEGLARAFSRLRAETEFHSRSYGICRDLSVESHQDELTRLTLDFDVFINSSYISHFAQLYLCRKVWTLWKEQGKRGLILNIGSSVRDLVRPDNRFYPTSKRALEDYSRQLHLYSVWGDSKIRVTCMSFGGIATERSLEQWPHFKHMNPDYCARVLDWALAIPEECNLDVLQITPVQPASRRELKKHTSLSGSPSDFLIADFDEP